MSNRAAVIRFLAFGGFSLFSASLGHAQVLSEVAGLPEARQRDIFMGFANNAIANLPSHTDGSGKAKSDDAYTRDRTLANLVSALFIQDPKNLDYAPLGPRVMLIRIKKDAAKSPNRTVLDVMGEVVDWSFQHFYNDFYTPEKKAEYQTKSDADQVAWFRMNIELYEDKLRNEQIINELKESDEKSLNEMAEMYDNAVVLPDGRHVLRPKNGDFMVIQRNPDSGPDVKLQDTYTAEAQRLYDCKNARGIKNGLQAREACKD
jgi:hypothetical protein